jgi:hypothetical protein
VEINTHTGPKFFMVLMSLGFGLVILMCQVVYDGEIDWQNISLIKVVISFFASLGYLFVGAVAVRICEFCRWWGSKGKYSKWTEGERLLYGAIWPLTLIVTTIVYFFLGIINRLF